MELRPYQLDIKNRVREAYRQYRAPCVVLPCRSGKSCIAADIAKDATKKGNRVLFLVHRKELCDQIVRTFNWWGVDMRLCDIMMVQTAARRLEKMPEYKFIITDENHHAPCSTYKKIYEHYPEAFRLGLTATPCRLNGKGLIETNDTIIEGVSVQWLLDNGYLSPYDYYAPSDLIDESIIKTKNGDFDQSDIMSQIDKPKVYGDVLEKWKKYANGKKTIVFASSIAHSISVRDAFRAAGIASEHVDGKTPKEDREQIMEGFRDGSVTVLCNYEIVSEGVDVPDCECCMLLRPTQSLTLYVQSSMRCLNPVPGKTAVILDMVGNFRRHGLPNTPRVWSLNGSDRRKSGTESTETIKARQCIGCYMVYAGKDRICPYCGFDNGKTRSEIEADEKAELEKISEINKKQEKTELKEAGKTLDGLIEYARKKGYKPGWAYNRWRVLKSYERKRNPKANQD